MKLEYCRVWITLSSALPIYIVDVHLKTVNAMTLEAGVKIVLHENIHVTLQNHCEVIPSRVFYFL